MPDYKAPLRDIGHVERGDAEPADPGDFRTDGAENAAPFGKVTMSLKGNAGRVQRI